MKSKFEKQLDLLFQETDNVWTGNLYELDTVEKSEFFVINPLKSLETRSNENVAVYRNFLFEFDNAALEDQEAAISLIEQNGLPLRTVVFSGSKSYHMIVSMADNLGSDYRSAWEALAAEISLVTGLVADPACKNPARLSRVAGFIRPDTGKVQQLVHTGRLITNATVIGLISKHKIKAVVIKSVKAEISSDMDVEDFKIQLRYEKGLHSVLSKIALWAQPAGMHPEILRLTLWAIDSIGVPKATFIKYAESSMLPHLQAANYPADKMYRSIEMAYERKGL